MSIELFIWRDNMVKKKKLLFSSLILIIALIAAITSVLAWFLGGITEISNVEFNTGAILVDPHLHELQDFNYDGIVDMEYVNGNYMPLIKRQNIEENGKGILIGNEGNAQSTNYDFSPNKTYSYRLMVENRGDTDVKLAIKMTSDGKTDAIKLNNALSFNFEINGIKKKISLNTFSSATVYILEETYDNPPIIIPKNSNIIFDFNIKFESVEQLKEWSIINENTYDLNSYKNLTLKDAKFLFEFRQTKD